MPDLTPKQTRFVAEYLVDLNATQAAIRAGYSAKTAQPVSSRLLSHAMVAAAVEAGKTKQLADAGFRAADVIEALRRQVNGDIRRLFNEAGQLREIWQLSAEDAALIAGFECVRENAKAGDGHMDTVLKVKFKDQARFVEMAAKHFGLLTDKVEHSGGFEMTWKSSEL